MTTLRRPPVYLFNRLESGLGDLHAGQYLDQQARLNDPFSRFGPRVFGIFEDFVSAHVDESGPTDLIPFEALNDGSSGTNALADEVGGVYDLVSAAADDDWHSLATPAEPFKFAAGKPLWAEWAIKLTEATTGNDAQWAVGLTNDLTTGGMQAGAAGPLGTYDGVIFAKVEDSTDILFESSNGGTQETTAALTAFVDATWIRLGVYFDGASTTSSLTPYWNTSGDLFGPWTKGTPHTITLSGLEEMHLLCGHVKAGPGGSAETLQIDWVSCHQVR